MRLAFALIVNIEPDILLIDESLAVGDLAFRQKCFARIEELKSQGTAFILVSHNTQEISRLCDQVIWLEQGRIRSCGDTDRIIEEYEQAMRVK